MKKRFSEEQIVRILRQAERAEQTVAEGFQIGPGPTESQCKSLAARLKGRGRRWNRSGIDAHMAIDCLYHNSKQWTTYWPKTPTP